MRGVLLVSVVLAAGCRGEKPPGPAKAGSGSGSAAAAAAAAKAGSGSGSGSAQQPADDPKAREAYRLGMKKGRKATIAKTYKEAIAGFDEALAAKPNDARALGERGFARLLEGSDLDAAKRDFDLATGGTNDPQLLSELWFNRGLVEEKRGNAENATAAFVVANTLRPSKAAQAKIAGKSACPVTTSRSLSLPGDLGKPAEAKSWIPLATALLHLEGDDVPKTGAEALRALTSSDQAPMLPALFVAGADGILYAYVVWDRGVMLRAQPIGVAYGGRCAGMVQGSIVEASTKWIHARITEVTSDGPTYVCQGKDDELVECTGKEGEVPMGTACRGGSTKVRDVAIDRVSGHVALVLEQPDGKTANVELADDGLKLSGLGCDRTEPFAKAGAAR
jgi:hypothetical protein